MDPEEPETPISRLERTLWTVWCYITETFSRVFRPTPANDNGSDTLQDTAVDGLPIEGGGAQAGTSAALSPSLQDDSGEACTEHAVLIAGDRSELKRSNEDQESREEEFDPTGNDEAGLFLTKAHENKHPKAEIKTSIAGGGKEVSKTEENEVVVSAEIVTGEDMEKFDEEDNKSPDTRDGHQKMDEPETEDHREGFEAEDGEVKMCPFTDKSPEKEHQILKIEAEHGNDYKEAKSDKNGELLQLISEKTKEEKRQLTLSWNLLEEVSINEATGNHTAAEEPAMDNRNSVADDRQEEVVLDQLNTICQEDVKTTEVAHKEEDVVDTYVRTTAETVIIPSETSISSKFVDDDCLEEDRLASKVNNKGVIVKNVSTVPPDMVKPESQTVQEISGEFKNIPMWIIEGQGVVPQELNPQVCKEAQEAVPEHNNEFQPDENTTQRFREGGNCQEVQITQLPEEVEKKEEESLKNSRMGADCLLMKEVKQASEENSLGLDVEQLRVFEKPIPCAANLESEHLYAKKETKAEESSMKTEIKPSDKEFETYAGSADELQGGTESADLGIDGILSDSKETLGCEWELLGGVATDERKGFANVTLNFPETGVEEKDMRFAEKNSSWVGSLPEKVTTRELWKEPAEAEPTFLDDNTAEMENVSTDAKDEDSEKADVQDRCESVRLEVKATPSEMTANVSSETQESENQSQDKALEMNEREKANTGVVDKLKTSELPELFSKKMGDVTQSEEICESFKGHQDVIDEDILDLWIETAMSEDFHDTESKLGDLLKEEPGETSLKEMEQLVESNAGEFVSDSGVSSAIENGVVQSSLSRGSLQGRSDICAASTDFPAQNSELPEAANQTVQLRLEVEDLTGLRSDTDSGVSSPEGKHQDLDEHQGRTDEELSESEQRPGWLENLSELHQDTLEHNHIEVDSPVLDFASQRSRIAVKNPRVRPPTNPRTLLQKPSADPTPTLHVPVKGIPGVPSGGLGIGFKLPGLGSGFPVLKKRQQADVADEDNQKTKSQEPEKREEDEREASQQEEAPHRPKWKPPGHLGFGNPLMSELKTKLKKTT